MSKSVPARHARAMPLGIQDIDDDYDVCVHRVMSSVWHWPKKLQAELPRMPRRPTPLPPLSAEGKPPHPHLNGVSMPSLLLHCMSAHAHTALSATSNQQWSAVHIKQKKGFEPSSFASATQYSIKQVTDITQCIPACIS